MHEEVYETVIGLEVHAQLLTKSKLFSADKTEFGGEPNTHISPVTLGYPGSLPGLNRKAVESRSEWGSPVIPKLRNLIISPARITSILICPRDIRSRNIPPRFAKAAMSPSAPPQGQREIQLNRIHLEEDAGKSLHDNDRKLQAWISIARECR